MRRVTVATVLAGLTAGGGAAAPQQQPGARTLLATHSRITQFARDGEWVAWTTVRKGCRRRLHLLSLRTGREVRVDQVDYHIACADGPLVLAGGRAAWATVNGHGNTEVDFAIDTAGPRNPKPRTVRTMATLLGDYEPEPPLPPLAGRASVLVYFRHDELSAPGVVNAVERIVDRRPKRVFRTPDVSYLAVDRGRIATVRPDLVRGDACNCNFDPAWSPDGDRLAFLSGREYGDEEDTTSDIYVSNVDGSGRTRITTDGRPKLGVAWSPDGTRLAFGYYDAQFHRRLAVVNADGSGRREIGAGEKPSWSPDGTKIAFDDGRSLFVADSDGSNGRRISAGTEPAWSPDGTWIAYVESGNLRIVHPDGFGAVSVASAVTEPAWSPDGSRIAGAARDGIWIWNTTGGSHYIPGTRRGDGHPSWSADGKQILYDGLANDLDGDFLPDPEIYVVAAEGGNPLPVEYSLPDEIYSHVEVHNIYGRLLSVEALHGIPRGLALDGHYAAVLAQATRSTQQRLYYVRAGTGQELRSVQVPSSARGPLSASGGRVVFVAGRTIRIGEVRSGEARILAFAGGPIIGVAINGRSVTWAENTGKSSGRIRTVLLPR